MNWRVMGVLFAAAVLFIVCLYEAAMKLPVGWERLHTNAVDFVEGDHGKEDRLKPMRAGQAGHLKP